MISCTASSYCSTALATSPTSKFCNGYRKLGDAYMRISIIGLGPFYGYWDEEELKKLQLCWYYRTKSVHIHDDLKIRMC